MMRDTLNYSSTLNYYLKKWCKVNSGLDTVALVLPVNGNIYNHLSHQFFQYSENSNARYYSHPFFPNVDILETFDYKPIGQSIDIIFRTDEHFWKVAQIFWNNDGLKFTIYWLGFRWYEFYHWEANELAVNLFLRLLEPYFLNTDHYRVARLDYRFDILWVYPTSIYSRIKKNNSWMFSNRNSTIITNKWVTNTIYIWSRKSKHCYSRIYNKYLDSEKKGKLDWYQDYINPTTRLEFQMGTDFTAKLWVSAIIEKLHKYIWYEDALFKWKYFVGRRVGPFILQNEQAYKTRWKNYTVKLLGNGIDLRDECDVVNMKQKKFKVRVNKSCVDTLQKKIKKSVLWSIHQS